MKLDITWTYDPTDYFEAPLAIRIAEGELTLADGTAEFRTELHIAITREAIATFTDYVRATLNARLLVTGRQYSLSEAQFVQTDESGRRHYTLFVHSATAAATVGNADVIVTSADGSVRRDTRAERIEADRHYLVSMTARAARSPTLRRMLESYSMSFSDPDNALFYLYEVRDAVAEHFGGELKARSSLGIPSGRWKRLGQLSNHTPVLEGRHRGRHAALRPATLTEIADARATASAIINSFGKSL